MSRESEQDFSRQMLESWYTEMVALLADAGLTELAVHFEPSRSGED